ncbi:TPA: hypothetical protein NOT72_002574 [Pseudomonas aeruginosa]|nr:hypothetical protein [Pseudomonas aeruginosa]
MKERPILFNDQMVRAILEGRKTVTRRVMKPQPTPSKDGGHHWPCKVHQSMLHVERELQNGECCWCGLAEAACPYGQPGDRLWVREAWAADAQVDAIAPRDLSQGEPIWYPADFSVRQTGCSMISKGRGRPSIHMPRWASRILLEITAVRIERLQDISEKQALAEGVELEGEGVCWAGAAGTASDSPVESFRLLWELINGAGSWNANPWVWVVEFKRVTP